MRIVKIALLILMLLVMVATLRAVASRAIAAVARVLVGEPLKEVVRRRVELSNGGILEVRGRSYSGPHGLPYAWDITYRPTPGANAEEAGLWGGGAPSGDLAVCKIDKLVVVVPFQSHSLFVRGATGHWNWFDLTLPGKAPAEELPRYAGGSKLTIEELHRLEPLYDTPGGSLGPGPVVPYLMQFAPARRELLVDYDLSFIRRFRLRLEVPADGERLKLLGPAEPPAKTYPLVLDVPRETGCTTVEMFQSGWTSARP